MSIRVIISGGGTGGHIFPAIAIANELRRLDATAEILFVGAQGGMEMTLVPQSGYKIEGVWISGIMRKLTPANVMKNLALPFKLMASMKRAKEIVRSFRPDVAVGVGGYASGPLGRAAVSLGVPLVLQEQNAYPGKTNLWLSKKATRILLGNAAAAKFFEGSKIKVTGNPVRQALREGSRSEGLKEFRLDGSRKTVLSLGGSLGAGTLNQALEKNLDLFRRNGVQLIWQCGKRYYDDLKTRVQEDEFIRLMPFIAKMEHAYAVADLVVSRAGASTLSELILLSKPSILVPSPNVAEDHQTKNALSLTELGAAVMVKDAEAAEKLVPEAIAILSDATRLGKLQKQIDQTDKHDSANEIAREIFKVAGK